MNANLLSKRQLQPLARSITYNIKIAKGVVSADAREKKKRRAKRTEGLVFANGTCKERKGATFAISICKRREERSSYHIPAMQSMHQPRAPTLHRLLQVIAS